MFAFGMCLAVEGLTQTIICTCIGMRQKYLMKRFWKKREELIRSKEKTIEISDYKSNEKKKVDEQKNSKQIFDYKKNNKELYK